MDKFIINHLKIKFYTKKSKFIISKKYENIKIIIKISFFLIINLK